MMKKILVLVVMIPMIIFSTGCPSISGLLNFGETTVAKATREIENTVSIADWQSDQWRGEAQRLVTKLESIDKDIAIMAKDIVEKSAGSVGGEIRCNTDFIRNRAKADLIRLKDIISGKPSLPPPPEICSISPRGLSMDNRPDFIEIYGYDLILREYSAQAKKFNETTQLRAYLKYDGGEQPLEQWVNFPSRYKMTIKTSLNDTINSVLCNKQNRQIFFKNVSGQVIGNSLGIATATCPAPIPQNSKPEKLWAPEQSFELDRSFNLEGKRLNNNYGGACSDGYERSRYVLIPESVKTGGPSATQGCNELKWVDDNPKNCTVNVSMWADYFAHQRCKVKIYEKGVKLDPIIPYCPFKDCK
jgi:hypothetical protein